MYRFQMMDGDLARMFEATMLVMEALEGLEEASTRSEGIAERATGSNLSSSERLPPIGASASRCCDDGRALAVL